MKKYVRFFVVIAVMMLGSIGNIAYVNGAEKGDSLLEGFSIEGPDYTYEYKGEAIFTLKKEGYIPSQNENTRFGEQYEYYNLHYKWSSNNENVAKFHDTIYDYFEGCIGIPYPTLERPNIFKIKNGEAVISCTISDDEGNSVVVSKNLTVLKETPIKELKVGKYKLEKDDLNADYGMIYTNSLEKGMKLEPVLEKGWKLKSEKTISFDENKDYNIKVIVENEQLRRQFHYILKIRRYVQHQINMKKLRDGCALVQRRQGAYPGYWFYALTIEYNKDSKSTDDETFKDGADLARKLIEYYDYDRYAVEYKNGILFYKETMELKPWTYCTNKEELNNAKEDAKARNDLLRGLSIEGPDYIYGIEDLAKYHLAKDGKSDKNISKKYKNFKFKWSSENQNIAKFKNMEKKESKKSSYPILQRRGVFKIKPGIVYIHCKITDTYGESVTMIKKVTVLKGRPIKTLKVGSKKLKKSELNSKKCKRTIYTKKKKVKLKMNLAKGWRVERILLHSGKKIKNLTKKKTFYVKPKKAKKLQIILKNKNRGQTFTYECKVKRG